jgi:sodium/potassium-transporting ATPase subunit alpha
MPLALTIPQVLAVDLGTDMIPALGLGTERPLAGVMEVPPRPRTERLLNLPLLLRTYLFLGVIEAVVAMGGFFLYLYGHGWTWDTPLDWSTPLYKEATTVTFAGIVLAQVANVFACRSDRLSIRRLGWFTNPLIVWGVVTELILLMLITYTPVGNDIFGTSPLPLWIYGPLALGALTLLLAEEGRKILVNRRHRRMNAGMAHTS